MKKQSDQGVPASEGGRSTVPAGETPSVHLRPHAAHAEVIASHWHRDQKYGDRPYTDHLRAVRDVLVEFQFGSVDEMMCAAWLHDILEDTEYPVRELAAVFGMRVLNLVWAVTGFGNNRKERARDAYEKIKAYPEAAVLKAADRIANMRASKGGPLEQMYLKAWPHFKYHLHTLGQIIPPRMFEELERLHCATDRSENPRPKGEIEA